MDDSQKNKCIKAIDPTYEPKTPENRSKDVISDKILGSFQQSGLPSMFSESWDKTNAILAKEGISKAPGTNRTRVFLSFKNLSVPHLVTGSSDWKKIKCDCKRFEPQSLCQHALAVSYGLSMES